MAAQERGLVAITGANGTIGYACTLYALKTGYRVRCIVRCADAIATIKNGPSLQQFADKVEYALVPDNTVEGSYDQVVAGAESVVHIAGVWPKPNYHPDHEIWYPFVKSMENILSAARKSGSVKRIVFTQAAAALISPGDGDTLGRRMDRVLDEFIRPNAESASSRPPLPSPHHAYSGAKAYCMTYLNDLRRSNPNLPFSIAQVIPGTVIGPSELTTTASKAYAAMDRITKALLFNDITPRYAFGFVHVEDCARVHIEALDEKKVKNEDVPNWFVAAAASEDGKDGEELWGEVCDVVDAEFGNEAREGVFNVGREKVPTNMPFRVDSALTERVLLGGEKFKSLPQCVIDVGRWYIGLKGKEDRTA